MNDEPTPIEAEAIRLRWRKQNPAEDGDVPPEEVPRLLQEVRERATAIERSAYDMLLRETRNPPTRSGNYSRHMQWFVFKVLTPVLVVVSAIAIIVWMIQRLGWL